MELYPSSSMPGSVAIRATRHASMNDTHFAHGWMTAVASSFLAFTFIHDQPTKLWLNVLGN